MLKLFCMPTHIRALRVFVIVIALTFTSEAQAVTLPRGKETTGIVESIDSSTQMITFLLDDTDKGSEGRIDIKWTRRTVGTVAGERVTLDDLRAGTRVTVRYVSPLFGPRVLKRISWCKANAEP